MNQYVKYGLVAGMVYMLIKSHKIGPHFIHEDEILRLVVKYFPITEVDRAMYIIGKESSYNANAHLLTNIGDRLIINGKVKIVTVPEDSRGLGQINILAHPHYANENLYDPETNIAAMAALQKRYGWRIWSTYKK